MRAFLPFLLLVVEHYQALADFPTAEAAMRRGSHQIAYLECKKEADAGDAECQNLVGYLFQEGLSVPENATEAIRLFRLAAKHGLTSPSATLASHMSGELE